MATILKPEEIAAHRVAYMHSLAIALVRNRMPHWNSATDGEREEVRSMLRGAGIKVPNEEVMALEEEKRLALERKRLAAAAHALLHPRKKRLKTADPNLQAQ